MKDVATDITLDFINITTLTYIREDTEAKERG